MVAGQMVTNGPDPTIIVEVAIEEWITEMVLGKAQAEIQAGAEIKAVEMVLVGTVALRAMALTQEEEEEEEETLGEVVTVTMVTTTTDTKQVTTAAVVQGP